MSFPLRVIALSLVLCLNLSAQTKKPKANTEEADAEAAQQRTKMMVVMNEASAPDFDLLALFRHLARADLLRAVQLAKTFTGEAPRAVATLAIARSVLEKQKDPVAGGN